MKVEVYVLWFWVFVNIHTVTLLVGLSFETEYYQLEISVFHFLGIK
jgi:hypothetical protein